MKFTLRQIQVFVTVAKYNSTMRASQELFLSQPAVSAAIAELESQFNEKLFDRTGKKLYLNESGRVFLSKAINLLEAAKEVEEFSPGGASCFKGSLRIGASTTIGKYLAPRLMSDFLKQHSEPKFSLSIGNSMHVVDELVKFNIDIGFVEGINYRSCIESIKWRQDQLVVFAATDHPLASKAKLTLKDLGQANWIMREQGSGTRATFERAICNKIDNINVMLELAHSESIKQAVETGVGISCLSELAIANSLNHRNLVKIDTPFLDLKRNFYILIHKEKCRTTLFNKFLNFCQEYSQ